MLTYKKITFDEFITHQTLFTSVQLTELSSAWLAATAKYMLMNQGEVVVHCLFDEPPSDNLTDKSETPVIAWPLVHQQIKGNHLITSLTSFYSAVTQIYFSNADKASSKPSQPNEAVLTQLISAIKNQNPWHEMLLGPVEQNHLLLPVMAQHFPYQRIFSQTANFYESDITDFEQYYAKLPSQLKNTIKRREKKLSKHHSYHIEIVANKERFKQLFSSYQGIYQLSWKGEEFSFDFIKDVCLNSTNNSDSETSNNGALRMGVLFIDSVPVAAQLWFVQNKCASIFKLAYDPNYQTFSVGSILSLALSKHVISSDNVTKIEFGMGNENYKKDWMSKCQSRMKVQAFNHRTLKGNLIALKTLLLVPLKNGIYRKLIHFAKKSSAA